MGAKKRDGCPAPTTSWGNWADTGVYRNSGGRREKQQKRTSNTGLVQYKWIDQGALSWGSWQGTGVYRGEDEDREQQESRSTTYSSYNSTEYPWVADPEPETWGGWYYTGVERDGEYGPEYEQARHSSYGNTEYRWLDHYSG